MFKFRALLLERDPSGMHYLPGCLATLAVQACPGVHQVRSYTHTGVVQPCGGFRGPLSIRVREQGWIAFADGSTGDQGRRAKGCQV